VRLPRSVLYLLALATLQCALSGWWLWISEAGGERLVPKETALLLFVSGPAAMFVDGSVAGLLVAICALVLFALLIAAMFVHHRPIRIVIITAATVWYALCGFLPVLAAI
jgi:hypothetical protein